MRSELSPERLLATYAAGIFPMADDSGAIHWLAPDPRCIIDLGGFKVSRSLQAVRRRGVFEVSVNRDFEAVIDACAQRSEGTWISPRIRTAYCELHRLGFAHSVECRRQETLAGGLYGVAIGGAFFGESMFHRESDASKVALAHLVARLKCGGFELLDTQCVTDHLRQFGAVEIPRGRYQAHLDSALKVEGDFNRLENPSCGEDILEFLR